MLVLEKHTIKIKISYRKTLIMDLDDIKHVKAIFGISVLIVLAEDINQLYGTISFLLDEGSRQSFAQLFPDPLLLIILSIIAAITMAYIYYKK